MALVDVRLETPRLVIRELAPTDAPAVLRWAEDPEVCRYVAWGPSGEAEVLAFLCACADARRATPRVAFELGFELRATGELVGAGGVRVRSAQHAEGDLGYTLRRDQWGRGLATEAARALVRFGQGVLGLHRIWATCHVENAASARVLEKAGLAREGRLRQNVRQRGVWRDSWLYAIVEGDPSFGP